MKRAQTSIRLNDQELKAIESLAKEYGISVSKVLRKIIISRLLKEGILINNSGIEGFYKYKDIQ